MHVECPECGEEAEQINPDKQDETGLDFDVISGGEIIGYQEVDLWEYELLPCGHTFTGTTERTND